MPDTPLTLNRVSLEELYRELEKPLYNVVFRYLWNREEAQDLVQEAFLRIWKMRARVEMITVRPLIYKICINLAKSRGKRKKILTFFSLDKITREPIDQNEDNFEKKEKFELLQKIVNGLPSKLKETVLLTEFSDMTYEEIGNSLGVPAGTVGSRRNKAVRMMKDKFKKIYG